MERDQEEESKFGKSSRGFESCCNWLKVLKNSTSLSRRILWDVMKEENGSISVLIVTLFLFLLILSLSILDASDAYLAKRELLAIGERALTKSVHQLSLPDYYGGQSSLNDGSSINPSQAPSQNSSLNQFVPLDCPVAIAEFERQISISDLRGGVVAIRSVHCEGNKLSAQISSEILPIINFPLLNTVTGSHIQILASPAAASIFGSTP